MKSIKIIQLASILMLVFLCSPVKAEIKTLHIPAPRSDLDTSSSYHVELLQKALLKAADGRDVPELKVTMLMEQDRAAHELALGRTIDIFWMGINNARARALRVIPIPLERGLIGYRQFIVHKKHLKVFEEIQDVKELSQFTACQGAQWPDTDILRDARLPVVTSTGYERLFRQLVAGRCDYFPRGFHEIKIEMAQREQQYPELAVVDSLILHYPFASYFFVRKDNVELAEWVERGLEKMIEEGEFIQHMQEHQHTRRAFPLATSHSRRILSIPNHSLPESENYTNPRYWFQPEDFVLTQ